MSVIVTQTHLLDAHRLVVSNYPPDAPLVFVPTQDGMTLRLDRLVEQFPRGQAGRWRIQIEFEREPLT